jgi:Cu/Ag efflux protein CusF
MKKIIIAVLLLLTLSMIHGCAGQSEPSRAASEHSEIEENVTPLPSSDSAADQIINEATGAYNGQVDNNSIEILVDGQPEDAATMVFMLTGDIKAGFERTKLQTGDTVQFAYYKNQSGQLVLTKIRKGPHALEATGIYQGQADSNFIEIKIDGQPEETAYMVFMLTGDIKINFEKMNLQNGDAVFLAYYLNESGQPVLTRFSKTLQQIEATGLFQGQVDSNFIEIKINGQPEETAYMVFMLTGDIKSRFEKMDLKTGDAVQLIYYKNESGQLVLTNLVKGEEQFNVTGIYQGQVDSNFIEIKIDGEPQETAYMVFMLTGDIKNNFEGMHLKIGDAVQLEYYKNPSGQFVLTYFVKEEKQIYATGVYQGQADSNFIEIKILGKPQETAYMVFMLTGDIKNNFEKKGLKTGDAVEIEYYKNNFGQLILTWLEKLQNK